MPKLNQKFPSELDIEDLHVKENIRKDYRDIPELAASIQKAGQIHAIGIDKDYNIIVGHRRYYAAVYLLEKKGIRIKLRVHLIQGDRKTLQAIENFHQSKMTASEEEQCIESFIADGMKQTEVAEYLCLTPQRINDMRAAGRVREAVESKGVDTSEISSSALSAVRGVEPEKLEAVIEKAIENGGTVSAAKKAVKDLYDGEKDFPVIEVTKAKSETAHFEDTGLSINYTTVKCSRDCQHKTIDHCSLGSIDIDSSGMCSNFKEV